VKDSDVEVTYDLSVERAMFASPQWRRFLDRLAFTITGHAVPYSGVDTGTLTQSMGHAIEADTDGYLEAVLGSGAATGTREVWYAPAHWADKKPLLTPRRRAGRKRREHPTKPAPTKPYVNAMRKLGIDFDIEPGGFET